MSIFKSVNDFFMNRMPADFRRMHGDTTVALRPSPKSKASGRSGNAYDPASAVRPGEMQMPQGGGSDTTKISLPKMSYKQAKKYDPKSAVRKSEYRP